MTGWEYDSMTELGCDRLGVWEYDSMTELGCDRLGV